MSSLVKKRSLHITSFPDGGIPGPHSGKICEGRTTVEECPSQVLERTGNRMRQQRLLKLRKLSSRLPKSLYKGRKDKSRHLAHSLNQGRENGGYTSGRQPFGKKQGASGACEEQGNQVLKFNPRQVLLAWEKQETGSLG